MSHLVLSPFIAFGRLATTLVAQVLTFHLGLLFLSFGNTSPQVTPLRTWWDTRTVICRALGASWCISASQRLSGFYKTQVSEQYPLCVLKWGDLPGVFGVPTPLGSVQDIDQSTQRPGSPYSNPDTPCMLYIYTSTLRQASFGFEISVS